MIICGRPSGRRWHRWKHTRSSRKTRHISLLLVWKAGDTCSPGNKLLRTSGDHAMSAWKLSGSVCWEGYKCSPTKLASGINARRGAGPLQVSLNLNL